MRFSRQQLERNARARLDDKNAALLSRSLSGVLGLACGLQNTCFLNRYCPFFCSTRRELIRIAVNLQLWDTFNLPWAKTVCVETCPQQESYCDLTEHAGNPCTNNSQYQCPYYFGADDELYGYLPDVTDPFDTQYYDALANTTKTECEVDSGLGDFGGFLNSAQDLLASADPDSAAATCGLYYQVNRTHVINSLVKAQERRGEREEREERRGERRGEERRGEERRGEERKEERRGEERREKRGEGQDRTGQDRREGWRGQERGEWSGEECNIMQAGS